MATGAAGMGDPEIMAMKVWKKSRSLGLVSLPDINLLKSPIEAYASREDLREHVDKLKKSFLRTQNCNRKGISFCVINQAMYHQWFSMSDEQRTEAMTPGSEFLKELLKEYLGCPTGDHTRIACQELADAYPQHPKYGHMAIKGIKGYLVEGTDEDLSMLRLMGTVDNWKREQHRSMQFSSRLWQMHNADQEMRKRVIMEHMSPKDEREMRAKSVKAFATSFEIDLPKVRTWASLAHKTGKVWALMYKIITGDYQFAPTRLGKKVQVDSESQFNLFSTSLSDEDSIALLQRVINGDIEVTGLRNAVKQITGAQRLKVEVMEFINTSTTTQSDLVNKKAPIKTWEDVVNKFPKLADPAWHLEWLPFTAQRTGKQGWSESLKGQAWARLNQDKPAVSLLLVCERESQQNCCSPRGLQQFCCRSCATHHVFSRRLNRSRASRWIATPTTQTNVCRFSGPRTTTSLLVKAQSSVVL